MQSTDVAGNALAYPVDPAVYRNLLSVRGYTHERPDEYNVQYGASVSQELPGAINLTVGYTGSQGKDMFLRGVANTFDNATRARPVPVGRPGRLQDVGLRRRAGHQRQSRSAAAAGRATTRCRSALTRRFRGGLTGGLQYQYSRNEGTTQGSNEAATASNTFDYNTEFGHQPDRHPAHVQRLARLHAAVQRAAGPAAGASAASSTRAAACRSTSPSTGPTPSRSAA